jgi:RNA polymerase sigma-70 factor, ECF subfamily
LDDSTEKVLALLADHGERLHALLVRLTLREDVAEDLMQELFLKLARNCQIAQVRDALAYAIRVATNLAFDWRRARRRMTRIESDENELHAPDHSPCSELIANEEFERVLNALDCLPRSYRDLVVMRYLQGQDYDAMARALGRTPHQVRALCCKALRRLRGLAEKSSLPRRDDESTPK